MFPRPSRVTRVLVLVGAIFICVAFLYSLTPVLIASAGGAGFESSRFTTTRTVREEATRKTTASEKGRGTHKAYRAPPSEPPRSVNPHDFRFIHNPSDLCRSRERGHQPGGASRREDSASRSDRGGGGGGEGLRPVTLLIYIHSAPANLKKRQAVRQTWAHPTLLRRLDAAVVFLLGHPATEQEQALLDLEASEYGDLVQEDFHDAYKNLTFKGVAALRWITLYCPSAVFLLKTDDDILVDIVSVVSDLKKRYPGYPPLSSDTTDSKSGATRAQPATSQRPTRIVLCNLWTRMKVMRDPKSKWFIPPSEFAPDFFPPYCSGSAFVLSADLAPKLYRASLDAPFFWVDDYYITGVLVNNLGVPHTRYNHAYLLNANLAEAQLANDTGKTLFFHIRKLSLFLKLWPLLLKRHANISELRQLAPTTHPTPSSIVGAAPSENLAKPQQSQGGEREAGNPQPATGVLSSKVPRGQEQRNSSKRLSRHASDTARKDTNVNALGNSKQLTARQGQGARQSDEVGNKVKDAALAADIHISRERASPAQQPKSLSRRDSLRNSQSEDRGSPNKGVVGDSRKVDTVISSSDDTAWKDRIGNVDRTQEAVRKAFSIPANSTIVSKPRMNRKAMERANRREDPGKTKPSDPAQSKLLHSIREEQQRKTRSRGLAR